MRNLLSLLLCLLIGSQAFADGKIAGAVTDGASSETLIGVSISLFEKDGGAIPKAGTLTDIDGNFSFEVAPGTYEIEIKYVGYQAKKITDIVVTNDKTTQVPVAMDERKNTELEEVVVQATLKKESVNALYTMQKNAVAVSDGISADVIKRSPDRSTSDVLKRISGTTIVDNKFVIVRGLSDRYNTALVDDAPLPSTEPNRKAFSFDIIPANMIDNIIITKSGTPDLPGDFAGGVINILTKEVPEENFNSISIGTGMNTASTFKSFKSGYRSPTDFIGFDNGKRELHPNFPTTAGLDKLNPNKPQQSVPYLKALNNDYAVREHSALPAVNLQASLGRLYHLKGNSRFGITAAVTYNHSENIKPEILRQYDNFNYVDNTYNYSTNIGALLNLGYYVGKSKFNLKTFYNRTFDDNYLERTGYNNSNSSDVKYFAYDLTQKSLFKTSLDGTHQIGGKEAKIDWLLSYNYITNTQPDQRKVAYARDAGTDNPYQAQLGTIGRSNNRLFSDMGESLLNGAVNFTQPFKMFNKSKIKIGAFGQYRSRNFDNRYLGMQIDESKPGANLVEQRPVETLFADDVINQGYYTIKDQTLDGDHYEASARTMGGYIMLDNKFTEKFRAVWGARLESYNVTLNTTTKTEVDRTWTDILPSLNLTYSLNDESNLRSSYFRSLARPEFRELTNLSYYDYDLSATINGNPNLTRTSINNFDLRYEWFLGKGEVFSASAFYKKFDNTLEAEVNVQNSSYDITTKNYEKAYTAGIELELRKNLEFLAPGSFLKNTTFYANMAYIYSEVKDTFSVGDVLHTKRPLAGQAPITINSSLSYAAMNGALNFTLLYNRIGQRLYLVGGDRLGLVYERPRNLLDFQVSYAVTKRSEFRLNMKDLINNKATFYFDQDSNDKLGEIGFSADGKTIDPTKDWLLQQYKPGRTFSLTYSYKF
jgi:TonB-dependent receptor